MNLRQYLICRIIVTLIFLISSTCIWFNKKAEIYHEIKNEIKTNEIVISDLKRLNESDKKIYNLRVENTSSVEKNIKVYIVPTVLIENVSNNYIKYQIDNNEIRTLNMDGMIIVSKLDTNEKKEINLKVWISDTYEGELNYNGRIVVV